MLGETDLVDWENSAVKLCNVTVDTKGRIEDCEKSLHADFANQYIGGGVLTGVNNLLSLSLSLLISMCRDVCKRKSYLLSSPNV